MDVQAFLESVQRDPAYAGQIVHVHTEPAREPAWSALPDGLRPEVTAFLEGLGITRVYSHQADAIAAGIAGKDVLVTTGPASGKSLCYQVPILQGILDDPSATAMLIFPMKALAHDQRAAWNRGIGALHDALGDEGPQALAYDGDAISTDKRKARDRGRLLVTNPEMLHVGLLANHARWSRILSNLRFVVIDEMHMYTGFFGANMANVVRRLERVCEHYGSRPQFICSSATVANPLEVAEQITGRALHHVGEDASASGTRTYVFWNPPKIKSRTWRGRRSANVEAHELMVRLIKQHVATICFSKARNTAEMMYRYVREGLQKEAPGLADKVVPYRGGYSPEERRDMERRLREGELLGVSATRALELGIDIGSLDACIVIGYPGWQNAFFQQMGRAGRAGRDSLCILVGIDNPINQYIMSHPEYVFERPIERAVVDRDNPFVVLGHMRCATSELPVTEDDLPRFGYAGAMAMEVLEEKKKVRRLKDTWYQSSPERPWHDVRLRGYGDESTVVTDLDSGKIIDRIDKFRALRIFYPDAIYFHHGDTYEMVNHDYERNVVEVRRKDVPYYTDPLTGTAVDHVDAILDERPCFTGKAKLGEVFAVLNTWVYEKVRFYSLDRISQHETGVPPVAYEAMSFWVEPPEGLMEDVHRVGLDAASGMQGILYCVSRILPLFLTSDANDFDWSLGCKNAPPQTMFWYEFYLHGIGNSEQCYERTEEILAVALEQLLTCDCQDGCPNCTSRLITPYHVRNVELGEGQLESRRAAVVVLNSLITGASASESTKLLDAPREKRGQRFLPSVTGEFRQTKPHQMPLNERTRHLMLRKLERDRLPKLPIDHPWNPNPQVGIPSPESDETLDALDAEIWHARSGLVSGQPASSYSEAEEEIIRTSVAFGRRVREKRAKPAAPEPEAPKPSAKQERRPSLKPAEPKPTRKPTATRSVADVARQARKLGRRRPDDENA